MNLQIVLGSETYGVDSSNTAITAQKNVDTLKAGSYLFLINGKIVYIDKDTTPVAPFDSIQLFSGIINSASVQGLSSVLSSVPIKPINVLQMNRDKYAPDVVGVYDISLSSLVSNSTGEAVMVLNDNSYNRTIQNNRINITANKRADETVAAFTQRIVDKINNYYAKNPRAKFLTASVQSNTTIRLTMLNSNTDFSVSMDGLFLGLTVSTITAPKPSTTNVKDILATEKEFSGNMGNGNYESLTDAWYSFPQQTVMTTNYDIFTIIFKGVHDLPQNKVDAAVMTLKIPVPTSKSDDFELLLEAVFGKPVKAYLNGGDVVEVTE